ncbi:hypothetical protein FTO70_07050 [Methanosarcina sp. KYL-1]|nr:hypothetical protein [Methanosarcina sp. KYL-1]
MVREKHPGPGILGDESAWADFLLSKAALIVASIVLFAALFHLAAGFGALEARDRLDFLARDFKAAVDGVGTMNFPAEPSEAAYSFEENEVFLASPFEKGIEVYVSGEYVRLDGEFDGKDLRAVKPFAFRVLPFNETLLLEKLLSRFGVEGREESPLPANYSEIEAYLSALGMEETVLDTDKTIFIKKEFIYVQEGGKVSAFGCVLVYQ